jgi:hypothetical protein
MERFTECLFNSMYMIGDNGTVRSSSKQRITRYGTDILKGLVKSDGYKMYFIDKKWHYEHRLVAFHYVKNKHNWKEINHIDGNKTNNHYTNLEWSTRKLNLFHMRHVLGYKPPAGINHWSYGISPSLETKQLMSDKKKGANHPKFKGYYVFNGVKYTTPTELSKLNKLSCYKVKRYCEIEMDGYSFEPI